MQEVFINYFAVVVSAAVSMVIGFLWYDTAVFGKEWARLMGFDQKKKSDKKKGIKEPKKDMIKPLAISFISLLVMAYIMSHLVDYISATTVLDGAMTGFFAWLGFVATVNVGSVLWEGRHPKLYFINMSHWLVVMTVMGTILAVWG